MRHRPWSYDNAIVLLIIDDRPVHQQQEERLQLQMDVPGSAYHHDGWWIQPTQYW